MGRYIDEGVRKFGMEVFFRRGRDYLGVNIDEKV